MNVLRVGDRVDLCIVERKDSWTLILPSFIRIVDEMDLLNTKYHVFIDIDFFLVKNYLLKVDYLHHS